MYKIAFSLICFCFTFSANSQLAQSFDLVCSSQKFSAELSESPTGIICYDITYPSGLVQAVIWDAENTEWRVGTGDSFVCAEISDLSILLSATGLFEGDNGGSSDIVDSVASNCTISNLLYSDDSIPTMGQWGLMVLGILSLIVGVLGIKQKVIQLEV